MEKIKILVDAYWFDEFYSGVTTYIKGLYNELIKHDKYEIFLTASNIDRLKLDFPDARFNFIKLSSHSKLYRLLFEYNRIIKENNIDYAHFLYTAPLIKNCKFIVTTCDLLFIDFPKYFPIKFRIQKTILFYLSAKRADILLTISEYSRTMISKHFRIPIDNILLTPVGMLSEFVQESKNQEMTNKGKDRDYLLYVSRIEPRKNHLSLIKAFVELKLYEKYELIFIGKTTIPLDTINKYMDSLQKSISEKIIHIENTSEMELIGYYKNASLFIFPSFAEGFGIPPLEALILGAKVICSNTTALLDFDFLQTYQFDPNDIESLKKTIINTLDDDSYPFEKMKSVILQRYSWVEISKVLINAIV